MIKVFIVGKGYNIEINGKLIVKCNDALIPFKDLLIHLGYDLSKYTVQIMDADDTVNNDTAQEEKTNVDDVILELNGQFKSPNLGKYRDTTSASYEVNEDQEDDYDEDDVAKDNTESKYQPVGNVECPEEGDLIYVDGLAGVLSIITGGVGTVLTIYKNASDILIELEETPGNYFSWNLLKNSQDELKEKYGYKPVCKI